MPSHDSFLAGISPRERALIVHGGWEKMGILMQPASEPAGELAQMRGESDKCEWKCV